MWYHQRIQYVGGLGLFGSSFFTLYGVATSSSSTAGTSTSSTDTIGGKIISSSVIIDRFQIPLTA